LKLTFEMKNKSLPNVRFPRTDLFSHIFVQRKQNSNIERKVTCGSKNIQGSINTEKNRSQVSIYQYVQYWCLMGFCHIQFVLVFYWQKCLILPLSMSPFFDNFLLPKNTIKSESSIILLFKKESHKMLVKLTFKYDQDIDSSIDSLSYR